MKLCNKHSVILIFLYSLEVLHSKTRNYSICLVLDVKSSFLKRKSNVHSIVSHCPYGFFVWTIIFKRLFVFMCLFSWLTVVHNSRPDIYTGKVFPTAVGIKFSWLMLLHCYQSFKIIFFIMLGKVNPHFSLRVPPISVASISTTVLLFLK